MIRAIDQDSLPLGAKFRDRGRKSKVLIRYSEVGQGFNPLEFRPRPDVSIKPGKRVRGFKSLTATRIPVTSFLRQFAHVPASILQATNNCDRSILLLPRYRWTSYFLLVIVFFYRGTEMAKERAKRRVEPSPTNQLLINE